MSWGPVGANRYRHRRDNLEGRTCERKAGSAFRFSGHLVHLLGADVGEDAPRDFQRKQAYAHLAQLFEALGFWVVLHFLEVNFASGRGLEALNDFPLRQRHAQVALIIWLHVWGHDEIPAHERERRSVPDSHGIPPLVRRA
jgi:hypothetical protein